MKPNLSEICSDPAAKLLILSDEKPGHLNQSIAFARHFDCQYEVCPVRFKSRFAKFISYFLDWLKIYLPGLYEIDQSPGPYTAVVSAGSETYYGNKTLARSLSLRSIAIMLPKGYRYNFDLIVAQVHDNPPAKNHILSLPINLTAVQPQGVFSSTPGKKYVALVIGGDSKKFRLEVPRFRNELEKIFSLFPGHEFLVTTSRRTPAEIERLLEEFPFSELFLYSRNPVNPIPDFLHCSEHVFVTGDSTSMISEAVSFGSANVEVLIPQGWNGGGKFTRFLDNLVSQGYAHQFDGSLGGCNRKVDLQMILKGILE